MVPLIESIPRDSPVFGFFGAVAAVTGFLLYRFLFLRRWRDKRPPLPPGPPGEFLLGHYRVVPVDAPFKKYAEWGKQYQSDVLYFETFGSKWVVLNSLKAAAELLEKRGSRYADRPRFVMFEEMGWSPTLTWLRWGPKYHLHRRVLQPAFAKSKVGQYIGLQRKEALIFCQAMVNDPESWVNAARRCSVAMVLKIAYGLDVEGPESKWIGLAEDSAHAIGKAGAPGSSILDLFPATRYLPAWLPFMERLRYARTWRSAIENITDLPFQASLRQMASHLDRRFFTHNRLTIYKETSERGHANEFDLEDIKGAAATVLIAGNDTTSATVMLLVLYLMQNPHVQRKAQSEIDAVLGPGPARLPTFDDARRLRYAQLILQETYRMNPLSPLGIPHASVADDVYEGMFIPKGTVVYQNVWAMMHDERVYAEPDRFWPERYLPREEGGNGEPYPVGNFGFGRRICVGRNLAENSLLMVLATMLATVDIGWPLGRDGKPEEFEPEWSFRGQATVVPFRAHIASRSEKTKGLLDAEMAALRHADF